MKLKRPDLRIDETAWAFVQKACGNGVPNIVQWSGWTLASNGHVLAFHSEPAPPASMDADVEHRIRLDPKHSKADPEAMLTLSVEQCACVMAAAGLVNGLTRALTRADLDRGASAPTRAWLPSREVLAAVKADHARFLAGEHEGYEARLADWKEHLANLQTAVGAAQHAGRLRDYGAVGAAKERVRVHRVNKPTPPRHTVDLRKVCGLEGGLGCGLPPLGRRGLRSADPLEVRLHHLAREARAAPGHAERNAGGSLGRHRLAHRGGATMSANRRRQQNQAERDHGRPARIVGTRRADGRCSACGASGFRLEYVEGYGHGYVCLTCSTVKPMKGRGGD